MRYRVTRFLGRGGMGQVYEARQLPLGRPVALKVMHSHLAGVPDAEERFRREAHAASLAQSPHVVAVIDKGQLSDGRSYIALELVKGPTLAQRTAEAGPMSWPRARQLLSELCDALQGLHEQGVVHRDLKPSNVLLARQGRREAVKLGDFGLAKLQTDEDGNRPRPLTGEGMRIGSLHYMSPEQASGRGALDQRSDIFSLGCLLHYALTGSPPFSQRALVRAAHDAGSLPELKLRSERPDLPEEVLGVLAGCLAADPRARFTSCKALKRALWFDQQPPIKRRKSDAPRLHWTRSSSFAAGLVGALAVGAVLAWLLTHLP